MSRKPARKPAPGRPFRKGDPRINRTKPGPGRPREEHRQFLRSWFDSDTGRTHILDRVQKSDRVLVDMHKQAYPPVQEVQVGGGLRIAVDDGDI